MATVTMKSAAEAQGTVSVRTDGACGARRVVHILTERPESLVERRRDEAVAFFEELGDANSTAISLIKRPRIGSTNPARQLCSCPEWHVLRLFGRGRGRVSFETGHEKLAGSTVSGVCQVCGVGLLVGSGRH